LGERAASKPPLSFENEHTNKEREMKKTIMTIIMALVIALPLAGGDWGYRDLYSATSPIFSFDTIQTQYTRAYDVGNGKALPKYLHFSYFIQPDTGVTSKEDSVNFSFRLDYSNDGSRWYEYGYLDTITIDTMAVKTMAEKTGTYRFEPYAFRYYRLLLKSATVDTFTVRIQQSYETY